MSVNGPTPVFDLDMTLAIARGSASAASWNAIRDVIKWLDSPGVRDLSAAEAAALLTETFEHETGERV